MAETIICPVCHRELPRERTRDGYRVKLKGMMPAPCCQKAATDGHAVVGHFVTEP